jgi:cell division protein FtsI/penicillin-binding protein 2
MMLGALGSGGDLLRPKIVKMTVGSGPTRGFEGKKESFPYQDYLATIGIDFPLYLALDTQASDLAVTTIPDALHRHIALPSPVRNMIFEGMRQVVSKGQEGKNLWPLMHIYRTAPEAIQSFVELKNQLIGKTGTGERVETMSLDEDVGTRKCCHVWFAGMSFDHDLNEPLDVTVDRDLIGPPELIVVVYFKYGGYGKDAAPVMAQMVKKWREIKKQRMSQ